MHIVIHAFVVLAPYSTCGQHKPDVVGFETILEEFSGCAITYFQVFNGAAEKYKIGDVDYYLENVRYHFRKVLLQVQSAHQNGYASSKAATSGQKFSKCTVQVFYANTIKQSENEMKHLGKNLWDFVWFLSFDDTPRHKNTQEITDLSNFLRNWLTISKPHIIFIDIQNFTDIYLTCVPCLAMNNTEIKTKILITTTGQNNGKNFLLDKIRQQQDKLYHNLHNFKMQASMGDIGSVANYFNGGQRSPCTRYPKRTRDFSLHKCVLLLFRQVRNISFCRHEDDLPLPILRIHHGPLTSGNIGYWKQNQMQLIHYAIKVDPYAYVLIVDKNTLSKQVKARNIVKPLDWWSWLLVAVVSLALSILLALRWKKFSCNVLKNETSRIWLVLTAWLLHQNESSVRLHCEGNLKQLLLVSTWCLFCIVMTENYKSFLFMTLSVDEKVSSPENLVELLSNKIIIGTTASLRAGPRHFPVFTDVILKDMIPTLRNDEVLKIFKELQKSVMWFTEFWLHAFVLKVVEKGEIDAGEDVLKVPYVFGLIDPLFKIHEIHKYFDMFGTKLITNPILEPVFVSKSFWMTTYNYVFQVFSRLVGQLYETGQYERWNNFGNDEWIKYVIKNYVTDEAKQFKKMKPAHTHDDHQVPRDAFCGLLSCFEICAWVNLLIFLFEILCGLK